MGWYILGCIVCGVFGFLISAICTIGKQADERMYSATTPIKSLLIVGNRSERRRKWRQSWNEMKREV